MRLSYHPYGAHAIPLENHKKNVPYEGRTPRRDRTGKTCTASQSRCKLMTETVLLLQNFVFFKMSDDQSEHHDREFYYPGEMSDAELL